jgi:hypothetical protein
MEKLNLGPSTPNIETVKTEENKEVAEVGKVFLGTTRDGASVYDRIDSHFHGEGGLTPE